MWTAAESGRNAFEVAISAQAALDAEQSPNTRELAPELRFNQRTVCSHLHQLDIVHKSLAKIRTTSRKIKPITALVGEPVARSIFEEYRDVE
ncbi:hypothetical protein KIN20_000998 [Parelaphostrongylus tenuis]|uniref:Uncharacterized protein n=1 Tax=Parelaphostrongylus tenuis TaxID=148309 RepID=A0AAD5LTE0_PARTN|nr:hypothetical protein KIN20_000998 [Parelaphostrongylus tenuis]